MFLAAMPVDEQADRETMARVGSNLRALADQKGMSLGTIAVNAHVDRSFVSRLFGLQSRQGSLPHVLRVCEVLGVTLDQALGLTPMPAPVAPADPAALQERVLRLEMKLDSLGLFHEAEAAADEKAIEDLLSGRGVAPNGHAGRKAKHPPRRRKTK